MAKLVILKLFDRSVDLAQFEFQEIEDPPLYPVCRAWVQGAHNEASLRNKSPTKYTSKPDNSNGTHPINDESSLSTPESFRLPPPKTKLEAAKEFNLELDSEDSDLRIPQDVRNFKRPEKVEEAVDNAIETMSHQECFEVNKQRWKKVRANWSEARKIHEFRYAESFKALEETS